MDEKRNAIALLAATIAAAFSLFHLWSSWGGTLIVVSHDAEFVEALQPDRALLMPDGTIDHWHDDFLELVTLA